MILAMLKARNYALIYGKPGSTGYKAAKHYNGYYKAKDMLAAHKINNDYYTMRNDLMKGKNNG